MVLGSAGTSLLIFRHHTPRDLLAEYGPLNRFLASFLVRRLAALRAPSSLRALSHELSTTSVFVRTYTCVRKIYLVLVTATPNCFLLIQPFMVFPSRRDDGYRTAESRRAASNSGTEDAGWSSKQSKVEGRSH